MSVRWRTTKAMIARMMIESGRMRKIVKIVTEIEMTLIEMQKIE